MKKTPCANPPAVGACTSVAQEMGELAYRNFRIITLLVAALGGILLAANLCMQAPFSPPSNREDYLLLHGVLLVLSVLFSAAAAWLHRRGDPGRGSRLLSLQAVYGTILCIWSCFITYLDFQQGQLSLTVYSYVALAVSCLLYTSRCV